MFRFSSSIAVTFLFFQPVVASAVTLVNTTSGELRITDAAGKTSTRIDAGGQFAIPPAWGDDRHLWFDLHTDAGGEVCSEFRNRWGTIKMPAFFVGVSVTANGGCEILDTVPEAETDPPSSDDDSDSDSVSDDDSDTGSDDDDSATPSSDFPPRGNGAWVYDARFLDGPAGQPYGQAGLWVDTLRAYNETAADGSGLDQVFSYGGDLEMECLGYDDCTSSKMHVYYYPPTSGNPSRSFVSVGNSGFQATQAYARVANDALVIPVFDGRFDGDGYLKQFHTLNEQQARTYADIFARTVCADPRIAGVQLDLEPFDLGVPAQAYFYDQIAKNLAGKNQEIEEVLGCVSERFPDGRFFSVFTFAGSITPQLGEMFTRYGNGYLVLSLYDLGPGGAGVASDPLAYGRHVANELDAARRNSSLASNVPFQLAIPAAASTKEFESYNGRFSGFSQVEYVEAALDAIDASGVREDEHFLGMALWGFSRFMAYPPHTANTFEPSSPPSAVQAVLAGRL
ncbi:MAG: hypothetical protein P8R42_19645 [Candidatus Binatia bacterium]|nr:hypothetical protein [Candidatus Binatia bacterium]